MLDWWPIAIFTVLALAGFWRLDILALEITEKLRIRLSTWADKLLRTISFTPFVVLALYIVPAAFAYYYLDLFSVAALTAACLFSTGLAFVMKYVFKRVRPLGNTTYLGKIDSAFPSAHTAGSFAAAFTLAIFWPAWSIPIFALASLVAISRMYLELHFFSDVMGGVLLAYLMVAFTLDSNLLTFLGL